MQLKHKLLELLAPTTSQTPIDTATLAVGHRIKAVEAELMSMYQNREVGCCKHTKDGKERVVWWLIGVLRPTPDSMLKAANRGKFA